MSGSNVGSNDISSADGDYSIVEDGDNCCYGYRFSLVGETGGLAKNTHVHDVYISSKVSDSQAKNYIKLYKKGTTDKYNKAQWLDYPGQYGRLTTKTGKYSRSSKSFLTKNPKNFKGKFDDSEKANVKTVGDWVGYSGTLTIDAMTKSKYTIIVEPIFCFQGKFKGNVSYALFTIADIAMYGKNEFGDNVPKSTSSNENSWGYIADFTNNKWPRTMTTYAVKFTNDEKSWGKTTDSGLITFSKLLTKGYGVGIAAGVKPANTDTANAYISATNAFLGKYKEYESEKWQFTTHKPIKSVRRKSGEKFEDGTVSSYSSYTTENISSSVYPCVILKNNGSTNIKFSDIKVTLKMYYDTGTKGDGRKDKTFTFALNASGFTKYKVDYDDVWDRGVTYKTKYTGDTFTAGTAVLVCLNSTGANGNNGIDAKAL